MRSYVIRPVLALLFFVFTAATPLSLANVPTTDYSDIDDYARKTPESAARTLATLSTYLTAPARSDLAKARSVYAWITSHVRYDDAAFSGRYSSEVDYVNRVLRNRKAVCSGFALLFKQLLLRAGVDVVTVKGYARTNDSDAGQPIAYVDHEWNAVRLDGDWYLLDLAWAQTTARPGSDGIQQPNDFFFLTDPVAFAANHCPTDLRWQLLNPAISKAQFDRFPKVYDAYFRLGFDRDFPKNGLLRASDVLTIPLQNSESVEFLCSISRHGGTTASHVPTTVRRTGTTYELTIPIQQRGRQTLYVFAKPKAARSERVKSYEAIASFTVQR